jgi:hypothetical protein
LARHPFADFWSLPAEATGLLLGVLFLLKNLGRLHAVLAAGSKEVRLPGDSATRVLNAEGCVFSLRRKQSAWLVHAHRRDCFSFVTPLLISIFTSGERMLD